MATPYAALISLINTISMERTSAPSLPPIPFDKLLIDSLLKRVQFFVECLEQGWKGAEHLEDRITDLAYAAEDAIESPIVDTVLTRLSNSSNDSGSAVINCQDLETIIQDMDSIKAEMMESRMEDLHLRSPSRSIGSTSGPHQHRNKMVGFEEEKIRIMEELERVGSSRQLISIHGMGGSGKTTLAQTIYDDQRIVEYFDDRGWVTVSQEYSVKEMLKKFLSCLKIYGNDEMDEDILGETIFKSLCGRRYLVVLDDIWDIDAWANIMRFFPDNSNGSRIFLTTRLSNLANDASICSIKMKPLDEDNSWKLLCEIVFGQGSCPNELEEVGKQIAQNCRGLPLTVAVIGGLLAKSSLTLNYWNSVAEDFSSYLNDNDHCLKILSLSYDHLPVHLKPCFLYMGIFSEDLEISISELTNLWVAEGFLKSHGGKVLEEIAEGYLKDLIERNLIMMDSKLVFYERRRRCNIHDLLRELSIKKAKEECFFCVVTHNSTSVPRSLRHQRRLVVQINKVEMNHDTAHLIIDSLPLISHFRSLILTFRAPSLRFSRFSMFKLLRIVFVIRNERVNVKWKLESNLVNLRYFNSPCKMDSIFWSNMHLFRNIQMQEFDRIDLPLVIDIWKWPQVRHLDIDGVSLTQRPSSPLEDCIILENLQTMDGVINLKLDEDMCRRIPNVRTLVLSYGESHCEFMIHNLAQFQKLESLGVTFSNFHPEYCCPQHGHYHFLHNVVLPHSLKKLALQHTRCSWEDMTLVGSLPNLEILLLQPSAFIGTEWNPVEGEFLHLKLLGMAVLVDLVHWNADCTHFPVLEGLFIFRLDNLTEIPLDIGEIPTLRSVTLLYCNYNTNVSAKNILKEQRNMGNDTLVVDVDGRTIWEEASDNEEESG